MLKWCPANCSGFVGFGATLLRCEQWAAHGTSWWAGTGFSIFTFSPAHQPLASLCSVLKAIYVSSPSTRLGLSLWLRRRFPCPSIHRCAGNKTLQEEWATVIPCYPLGIGSGTPLWMPKSADSQVPCIKWGRTIRLWIRGSVDVEPMDRECLLSHV